MAKFATCDECLLIARDVARATVAALDEAREREMNASVPFVARLMNMTEAEWTQMAEALETSSLGLARRRAVEHRILTGHSVPTLPFGYGGYYGWV